MKSYITSKHLLLFKVALILYSNMYVNYALSNLFCRLFVMYSKLYVMNK